MPQTPYQIIPKREQVELIHSLYDQHRESAISIMVSRTSLSHREAHGYFIDALIILQEKLVHGGLEHHDYLKSYLISTMKNLWRTHTRKKQKVAHAELVVQEMKVNRTMQLEEEMINPFPMMNCLPLRQKKIIEHYYVHGHSLQQIATDLGYRNAAVVKNLKHRAVHKCRSLHRIA